MKKALLLIATYLILTNAFCQQKKYVSFKESSLTLTEFLEKVTSEYDVRIYYKNSWTDTVKTKVDFTNLSIEEALDSVLNKYNIYKFRYNDDFILTKDVIIIEQPKILQSIYEPQSNVNGAKGMVFQKDLEKIQSENRDLNLIEVGNRAKYNFIIGYVFFFRALVFYYFTIFVKKIWL